MNVVKQAIYHDINIFHVINNEVSIHAHRSHLHINTYVFAH